LLPDLRLRNRLWLDSVLTEFQPDVIHAHDFSPIALIVQDWARQARLPFLVTLHFLPSRTRTFVSKEVNGLANKLGTGKLYQAFVSKFLNLCDGVITLNQAVANDLKVFGYKGVTYDIPNGRNLTDFTSLNITDSTQPEKQLLYIGAFGLRKNQQFLLEMLRHLSFPVRLELIGDVSEPRYMQQLKEYASSGNLSRVTFVDHVPFECIPSHFQEAHVFVSASTLEVQSLVIIEALASGTPVVALANDTTVDLIDEHVGCCLPANATPEQFARQVDAICNLSPVEYATMCDAARERVRNLDWSNIVKENIIAYNELVEIKRRVLMTKHQSPIWKPALISLSTVAWTWHDLIANLRPPVT
jgi:1,2-diacylglycerol 3-alpha-glucosyltransferase